MQTLRQYPGFLLTLLSLSVSVACFATSGIGLVTARDLAAIVAVCAPAVLLGRTLSVVLGISRRAGFGFAFEIVVGFSAFSLLHLACILTLRMNAAAAWLPATGITGALFAWKGRSPQTSTPCALDLLVMPAIAGVVAVWDNATITSLRNAVRSGEFMGWKDLLVHATQITYLRGYAVFGGHSLVVAGTAQYFYHRASYALPAAFSALSGRSSLEVATCMWQPLGLLLMGTGVFGFVSAIAGRAVGAAAAVALFLVPDAAMYGACNAFFGFHWFVFIAPASGYGIAIIFVALSAFAVGRLEARPNLLHLGALLALSALAFKVQVAVPAVFLFAALEVLTCARSQRPSVLLIFGVLAAAGVPTAALLERVGLAPHFFTGSHDPMIFLQFANSLPSRTAALYARQVAGAGVLRTSCVGITLLMVAEFGAVLPVAFLIAAARIRRGADPWIESLPFSILAAYVTVIFIFPSTDAGNFTTYDQTPFVLVYAVLLAGAAAGLGALAAKATAGRPWLRLVLGLASVAAMGLGLFFAHSKSPRIQLSWGDRQGLATPTGVVDACQFLREHAAATDCVASADADPDAIVAALSERTSFLSRPRMFRSFNEETADVVAVHGRILDAVRTANGFGEWMNLARSGGFQWLIAGDAEFADERLRAHAVFRSSGVGVYDLR